MSGEKNKNESYLSTFAHYSGLKGLYNYFVQKEENRDNFYMLGSEFQPTFPEGAREFFHKKTQEILASREERKKHGYR